jgi:predicted  nucleic acid-binding Zn-ribbon protein
MKKILFLALVAGAFVAFVGLDAVKGAVHHARSVVREHLTNDVPLRTQLAEAQALVDAYAESVIRGEVAAENLEEMIGGVEREVRVLETRVTRERDALVLLQRDLEVVATSTSPAAADREALAAARRFRAHGEMLERRQKDLERLRQEHANTLAAIQGAKTEQVRLTEEIRVLAAEIESLEARTAAAQTRESVGDAQVSSSGFAAAEERIAGIRSAVRERDKLLEYYEYARAPVLAEGERVLAPDETPGDPRQAVEEALAAWPAR